MQPAKADVVLRHVALLARIGVLVCLLATVGLGVVSASGSPAGTPVAWGCGNGEDLGQCTVPSGLNNVTAVSAGYAHSLAQTTVLPPGMVLDTFNRPDGSIGTNWVGSSNVASYKIVNNQVQVLGGGPIYWKPASFGVDQEAFVTFTSVDPNATQQALILKVQGGTTPSWKQGAIRVLYDPDGNHGAGAVRVETFQPLATAWTRYPSFNVSFASDDQFGARALAIGNVEIYKNGAFVASQSLNAADQTFFDSLGGKIGLAFVNASHAILDNFGSELVAP